MRVAVVTGASGVLGRATARALAIAGATVCLVGRKQEALEAAVAEINVAAAAPSSQPAALPIVCDVTDEAEVMRLFADATKAAGAPPDLLVNCVGIMSGGATVDMTAATFDNVMKVNVMGTYICCREAFKVMSKAGGGRIINIGSLAARSPRANSAAYTTSKFALDGLTRSLALDGRPLNIAVGIIHPGNVESELIPPEERKRRRKEEGYIAAEDVAASVLHMASLPLSANVLEMTVLPSQQPFVGRG
uniref:Ketoreductase domain-containing protein n=1 Tax=Haptolina brevifila TaxID=156173 RepID=A0A7S2MSS0_9EUKA|mmetsp:Transcript_57938/g.115007  ORF Transcript_57938/g.115007 Transcript_57938/m.115007 type:complete len:248 (+) Transcript_57938:72-815(+)